MLAAIWVGIFRIDNNILIYMVYWTPFYYNYTDAQHATWCRPIIAQLTCTAGSCSVWSGTLTRMITGLIALQPDSYPIVTMPPTTHTMMDEVELHELVMIFWAKHPEVSASNRYNLSRPAFTAGLSTKGMSQECPTDNVLARTTGIPR